jgi:hypothetical protein
MKIKIFTITFKNFKDDSEKYQSDSRLPELEGEVNKFLEETRALEPKIKWFQNTNDSGRNSLTRITAIVEY